MAGGLRVTVALPAHICKSGRRARGLHRHRRRSRIRRRVQPARAQRPRAQVWPELNSSTSRSPPCCTARAHEICRELHLRSNRRGCGCHRDRSDIRRVVVGGDDCIGVHRHIAGFAAGRGASAPREKGIATRIARSGQHNRGSWVISERQRRRAVAVVVDVGGYRLDVDAAGRRRRVNRQRVGRCCGHLHR